MKIQLNQQELNQAILEFVSKRHKLQEGSTVAVTFTAQNNNFVAVLEVVEVPITKKVKT